MKDCDKNPISYTKLRILYWNSRSVRNKVEEISKIIQNIDIFVCVESWLRDDIKFQFAGFNTLRKDRDYSTGGGIAFLIRKSYNYIEIKNLQQLDDFTELCGIEIINIKEPISIIACYKPPDITLNDTEWSTIVSNSQINSRCLFVGDFNSHNQSWNCAETDANGERLLEQSEKFDLFLHNSNTVTRIKNSNNYQSNIDLVFSSTNMAHLLKVNVSGDSHGSDHFPVYIDFDTSKFCYYKKSFKIQSKRTNWTRVTELLDLDYNKFLRADYDSSSPIQKYYLFTETITRAVKQATPKKKSLAIRNIVIL